MVSILNGSNIIGVAITLTSGYLITDSSAGLVDMCTFIESSTPETIIETVDPIAYFEWISPDSEYQLAYVSDFPVELRETSREIKEYIINTLIEAGKATRADFINPRSVLIRYPFCEFNK